MIKVLVTRPRSQSITFAQALTDAGFEPVFFPVIEIRPIEPNIILEQAIKKLESYDWVVFTSVNGVALFFETLRSIRGVEEPGELFCGLKTAAIGVVTAEALQQQGVKPDFIPGEYVAEAILPGLGDLRGRWVLLPRADIARKALPEAILEAGGIVHEISVYKTAPAEIDPEGLAALRSGVDVVTFTSSSTVENFVRLVRQAGLDPLRLAGGPIVACIGPITQQTAIDYGFHNLVMAEEYTTAGLVKLLQSTAKEKG